MLRSAAEAGAALDDSLLSGVSHAFTLSRGLGYGACAELALKLKETCGPSILEYDVLRPTGVHINGPDSLKLSSRDEVEPFSLEAGETGRGSVLDPNAPTPTDTAAPTGSPTAPSTSDTDAAAQLLAGVQGQSAADYTCSKVNN